MSKGSDAERELASWFYNHGYASLRAPGSGSIDRPSPDVFASNGRQKYGIELKNNAEPVASFAQHEVEELISWCTRCIAEPWLVIKPDLRSYDGWVCIHAMEVHQTEGGNYSIRNQDLDDAVSREVAFL